MERGLTMGERMGWVKGEKEKREIRTTVIEKTKKKKRKLMQGAANEKSKREHILNYVI